MVATPADAQRELSIPTLVASTWAACTIFWSIFTPPHKTFAARVLLFQPAWLLRIYSGDATWAQDLLLSLGLHNIHSLWTGKWEIPVAFNKDWLDPNDLKHYVQVFSTLGVCAVFAALIVYRGHHLASASGEKAEPLARQSIEDFVLPPLLIPSRTTHSRLFPAKHAFSYSYLFVGIPIGFRGHVGSVLSVDHPQRKWFDVQSTDYLDRGKAYLGLGEKLKRYLHTQGVTDREYAFAYLVTAPRFFGYSFNPVSFWYLYDSDTRLKYMILEVNNTFDERRMYLLRAETGPKGDANAPDQVRFEDTWTKDFHVSPFNGRDGSYSLRATDPLAAFQATGTVKIDNNIVLRSAEGQAKLVARVFSVGAPSEPAKVTLLQLTRFLTAWWWVGLATFPRIVWEAQKLFLAKKLRVWARPEVTATSLGRGYTADEAALEEVFHAFLTHVVEHARAPLRVVYEAAGSDGGEAVLYSPGFTYEQDHRRTLTLKIASPAFYSRFVHYAHAKEAFDRECLTTHEKSRTLVIEAPELLPALLEAVKEEDRDTRELSTKQTVLDRWRWGWLRRARCPPAAASYPSDSSRLDHEYNVNDIRTFQLSELDRFVQRRMAYEADIYRRILTKLFLAERCALGVPASMVLGDILLRCVLVLLAMLYCDNSGMLDVLRPREYKRQGILSTALGLTLANAVHLWSFAKG